VTDCPHVSGKFKMGTTSFMLVMHVLATVALPAALLELAGRCGLRHSLLDDGAGRHPGPAPSGGAPQPGGAGVG